MHEKIRVGVLGCASIAQRSVIPAIIDNSDLFELVAVSSRNKDKADVFSQMFSCDSVHGYDVMLARQDIDAVYIPLPTGLHKEWICKALIAGKHVYAEKSIAMCYEDACEIIRLAQEHNLAVMEGYMFQYHSQHKIAFDLIRSGEIGEIRYFSSSFGFPPLQKDNFRYDEELGGGVLMDAAGYPLRATHFILGPELKVVSAAVHYDSATSTSMWGSAFLSDRNGLGASISFGFDNYYQCFYEIWGSKGKLCVERAFTPKSDYRPIIQLEKNGQITRIEAEPDNHFVKSLQEFALIIHKSERRVNHYEDILLQSSSLQRIRDFSASGVEKY